jgi:adenylylsulfate kinase
MVIWLIGLSGAGKTSIGRELCRYWKERAPQTVLVDGDEIRRIFQHDRDEQAYTLEGRRRNAERIRELCAWLDRQDINVVCCILSLFEDVHAWNRATYSRYFEVFVDAPMDAVIARDVKGLYGPALRGETRNVVGVDIPFPRPAQPDMTIDNSGAFDPAAIARRILAAAHPNG